jgi:ketosteroid isomerase-like protein
MHLRSAVLLLSLSSGLCLTACTPPPVQTNPLAEASTLRSLDRTWSETAARFDLPGTVAYYADDAVLLPPNEPLLTGRAAIQQSWADLFSQVASISWKVTKAEVATSGELGYLYGTYAATFKDPKGGPPVPDTGKLVEVWKKQADGTWKCIVDTYNSDLPLAPPPTPARK